MTSETLKDKLSQIGPACRPEDCQKMHEAEETACTLQGKLKLCFISDTSPGKGELHFSISTSVGFTLMD
ncbi:hypothetical protein U0070_014326 [Myodes glareolus]|uniref:Uncharacterized protein n=1 Tax=Myodes glareolus TaxID=447135 RepID=A0AAW0IR76_MYOGA